LYAERDLDSATIELKNAINKQDEHAQAHLLLGHVRFQLNEYPQALLEYQKALDLGLDDDEVRAGWLQSKVRMGRYQEVIGELADQSALTAPFALVLADAYFVADEPALAQKWYQRSLSLPRAHVGLATIAWSQGDLDRAGSYFDRAVEMDKWDRDAWLRRGDFYLAQGDASEARRSFEVARGLPGGRMAARLRIVRSYLAEADLETARRLIDEIVGKASRQSAAQYLKGLVAYEQGDDEVAEKSLDNVLRADPNHAPARYLVGLLQYRQGRYASAEKNLTRFLDGNPQQAQARKLLASTHMARRDFLAVVRTLEPITLDNQDPEVLALIGSAYMSLGDLVQGTAALERAVQLAPDAELLRNQLALGLMGTGDDAKARALLEHLGESNEARLQGEYLSVMLWLKDGDTVAAEQLVDQMLARNPDGALGYSLKGSIALSEGDTVAARAAFEAALDKDPLYLPAVENLAALAMNDGDSERAADYYEGLLERDANNVGALLGLADMAMQRAEPNQAEIHLRTAIDGNAESIPARVALLRLYVLSNDLEKARAAAEDALRIAPGSIDVQILRAEVSLRSGDATGAVEQVSKLQEAFAQADNNAPLALAVGGLQVRVGNLTLARRNFTRALELSGDEPIQALRGLLQVDVMEGALASARRRLERVRALGGAGAALDLLEGDLELRGGNLDRAEQLYRALSETEHRDATLRLAQLYTQQGERERGDAVLRDWLVRNSSDTGAKTLLATNALQAGHTEDAVAQFEKMMPTDDPVILNNLAWLYMQRRDERALELARRAYEKAPGNAEVADTFGWILLANGMSREAVSILTESARSLPDNATIQYHLGIAHMESGSTALAKMALQRAIDLGRFPEFEQAREALDTL
tara:strand:- start:1663 stop:4296 length:2634 start_codon:yes stop_codon:yes gene_type:complete